MAYRRVLYGLVLAGVLLFQITNENYLAHFLLGLCVVLPPLSLALSLPGMLGCRVALAAAPAGLDRGERGLWRLSVDTRGGLPLSRLDIRSAGENLLTGETHRRRLRLSGVARRKPVELAAPTAHCGLLELRAEKIRVYDYLGLFSLRLEPPLPARILCRPIPAPVEPPALPEGRGTRPAPASAARPGPGEDYDLREYRPGDPMRSVHWKLSSKRDELIVRERAQAMAPLPLLTLDLFGEPDRLDRLLDQLTGLSRAMLNAQRPHAVLWLDRAGERQLYPVGDEREYALLLEGLLRAEAPRKGTAIDGRPELLQGFDFPVFRVHVALEGGDGHG